MKIIDLVRSDNWDATGDTRMQKMKFFAEEFNDRYYNGKRRFLRQFGRDEDGSLIILMLVLLVVMLVIGGMAVDFMRFESRRVLLQSVSDRAVLAAADLDIQHNRREAIVIDYFKKAGFDGAIVGTPYVSPPGNSQEVAVRSQIDVPTFYLRLIGIDKLTVPAISSAIEGTGSIEIAMVLDISGSMGTRAYRADGSRTTRIQLLKEAATNFNNELLTPENKDQVSISLVAYTANVNVGDHILSELNTTPTTLYDTSEWQAGEAREGDVGALINPPVADEKTAVVQPTQDEINEGIAKGYGRPVFTGHTNPSNCVHMPASQFGRTDIDGSIVLQQIEHFDRRGWSWKTGHFEPNCPKESFEGIIPLSQNATVLNDAITQYQPRNTTSIHDGMKWGVAMLDPSFRDILSTAPLADPVFRGVRPADYTSAGSTLNTVKYLVLMTDGENFQNVELIDTNYENVWQRRYWSEYSYNYWAGLYGYEKDDTPFPAGTGIMENGVTVPDKNTQLDQICTAAKAANIIVFTIAMDAPSNGETVMRKCASGTGQYFEAEGDAIIDVFQRIASQITELRLSL